MWVRTDGWTSLAPDAEVATDDPFLACCDFSAFVQQAVLSVSVEEKHADFELCSDWWRSGCALGGRIGIEDCLAAFASSG